LYTVSIETKEKFGESLVYTIPFVIYGILRYLYLIYKTNEGEPTKLVTSDIPLILTITFWIITSIILFIDKITRGQLETVLRAKEYINNKHHLVIYNIDTYFKSSRLRQKF